MRRIIGFAMACASCAVLSGARPAAAQEDQSVSKTLEMGDGIYDLWDDRIATLREWKGESVKVTVPEKVSDSDGHTYTVTVIGKNAFADNTELESVSLPEHLKSIEDMAFMGCTKLSRVDVPDSVLSVATMAFYKCAELAEVHLPDGLAAIGANAFDGCTSLTDVVLPKNLKKIQTEAFAHCPLSEISVPESVVEISPKSFGPCSTKLEVDFAGSPNQWDEATRSSDAWFNGEAAGRASVTCRIPSQDILKDVTYSSSQNQWVASIEVDLPDDTWEVNLMPFERPTQPHSVNSTGAAARMYLSGEPGEFTSAIVTAQREKGTSVDVSAEGNLSIEMGWSPYDDLEWIEVSAAEVKSGDSIALTVRPPAGDLDMRLACETGPGCGSIALDDERSVERISLSADGKSAPASYTYRGRIEGDAGDTVQLYLDGEFSHDLGHGDYRIKLPAIRIGKGAEPEATAKPTPTASSDPERTESPQPTEEPSPSETALPSPTMTASSEPSGTASPEPSETHSSTPSPTAEPSESVEPSASDSAEPSPSASGSEDAEPKERAVPKLKDDSDLLIAIVGGDSLLKGGMAGSYGSVIDAGALKEAFDIDEGITIEIVDHDGNRIPDYMPLATGYEIVFRTTDGELISRIPIVVQGDVCGIGYMNLTQLVRMSRSYVGKSRLIGCYLHAGDFDGNGTLDLTDLVTEASLYKRTAA